MIPATILFETPKRESKGVLATSPQTHPSRIKRRTSKVFITAKTHIGSNQLKETVYLAINKAINL